MSLRVSVVDRNGKPSTVSTKAETDLTTDTGTGIFGPTHSYPFTVNFSSSTGLSGIEIANQRFSLQDSVFVNSPLSSISPGLSAVSNPTLAVVQTWTFNITAAVRSLLEILPVPDLSHDHLNQKSHNLSDHLHSRPSSLHPILPPPSPQPSRLPPHKPAPSAHGWTILPKCSYPRSAQRDRTRCIPPSMSSI